MAALSELGMAALAYARKGWPVFPCHGVRGGLCTCGKADCPHPGKVPYTARGFKDASTGEKIIRQWWARWPDGNIAYPTGSLVVLDVDGEQGELALAGLEEQNGSLPETLEAMTGNGRHLYFDPSGTPIRNSSGKLGERLDIRGQGGYVIVPPSVHASGVEYTWLTRTNPAPLPGWIAALLSEPERKQPRDSDEGGKIHKGQRNAHLTSLAGSMRRRGMSQGAIEAALLKENAERCEPPLPDAEVRRIAQSVSRYDPSAEPKGEIISRAKMREFSSINPEPLHWLWPWRIPLGKLTLIAGDPGLGKSLLTVDIAARGSTGTSFPDGAMCEQGDVIFLSAEDDAADTIRPRLDAAGADVSRVHWLEAVRNVTADGKSVEGTFNLERDIDALEDALFRTGARLICIDPISAYLGSTDSHANADVRGLLAPLSAMAAKYKTAIVAVTHLRKSAGAAIYRTMGSLAFAAAARSVWGVIADPDDKARRLLLPVKQNLAPDGGGLAYRIEAPGGIARIVWEPGAVAVDVNAVMGGFESREDHSERREAEEWLQDFLAEGPQPVPEIQHRSKQAGLAWITVRRAKKALGVDKRKRGGRGAGWEWFLLGESKDAHPSVCDMSTFDNPTESKGDKGQSKVKDAHVSNTEHLCQKSTFEEGEV